jgi:uncharacterized membrane protein
MLLLILRLLHIVAGSFWVGTIVVAVFFVEPTAKAFGPTGERFLAHLLFRRHLMPLLVGSALVSITAGAVLYWIDSGGLGPAWITSPTGLGFTTGAVAALAAFLIALVVLKPEFDRLATLTDEATSERDQGDARNERRVRRWSLIEVSLLLIALAAMATARYWPLILG